MPGEGRLSHLRPPRADGIAVIARLQLRPAVARAESRVHRVADMPPARIEAIGLVEWKARLHRAATEFGVLGLMACGIDSPLVMWTDDDGAVRWLDPPRWEVTP